MSQVMYVGIDLGGTAIKLAFVDRRGKILFKTSRPTQVTEGEDRILYQMNEMIEEGLQRGNMKRTLIKGIGIGAPAFLELETGFVYEAVNLGWKQYPLKEKLEEITGLPVFVDNDANTAALGEMWQGAGKGSKDLVCITLGTGVGGGIIVRGQIYHGHRGSAGEVGHYTVLPEGGYLCNCGKTGCLETIASATGIVRLAQEGLASFPHSVLHEIRNQTGSIEAKDVAQAAEEGDRLALDVIRQAAHALGLFLGNYAVMFNPEKVVIGGGVSQAGEILFKRIREEYRKYTLPHLGDIDIVEASLGNDAGAIGAAWLVHTATEKL